jgi:hypothetical protein
MQFAEHADGGQGGGPLAPKTVRHAHVVLRKSLADAERMGLVTRNASAAIVVDIRPPHHPRQLRTMNTFE